MFTICYTTPITEQYSTHLFMNYIAMEMSCTGIMYGTFRSGTMLQRKRQLHHKIPTPHDKQITDHDIVYDHLYVQ